MENGKSPEQELAKTALKSLVDPWAFTPVNCIPVGHGIVEQIGRKLRDRALIPEDQVHDSYVVAEAALYGVTLLISNDAHIKNIDQTMLKLVLDSCDVACPLLASPWKIVHQFFR